MLVEKLKPYPCSENCQYRIHPQCDSFHKYHIFTADVPLIRVGILEVELLPDGRACRRSKRIKSSRRRKRF
jgi:hypothetical protein